MTFLIVAFVSGFLLAYMLKSRPILTYTYEDPQALEEMTLAVLSEIYYARSLDPQALEGNFQQILNTLELIVTDDDPLPLGDFDEPTEEFVLPFDEEVAA